MPKLRKGESKENWMSRCYKTLRKEGKSKEKSRAQCYAMWKSKNR